MKTKLINFITEHYPMLQDIATAIIILMVSVFIKMYKIFKEKGQLTFRWLVAEGFMSAVVGASAYIVLNKFFKLDQILVNIICVWLGSMSNLVHQRLEDVVGSCFDKIKDTISNKRILIFLVFFTFTLASCSKKLNNTHTIERYTTHSRDSIVNREISKAITDSLFVKINQIKSSNPACDSLINLEIKKLLQQIASLKKSGKNELGFYYDDLNKRLVAFGKIEESIKESIKTLENNTDTKTEVKVTEVAVRYTPKYIQILACLGGLFIIYTLYRIKIKFINPLS